LEVCDAGAGKGEGWMCCICIACVVAGQWPTGKYARAAEKSREKKKNFNLGAHGPPIRKIWASGPFLYEGHEMAVKV
jgi:hypothetical protein